MKSIQVLGSGLFGLSGELVTITAAREEGVPGLEVHGMPPFMGKEAAVRCLYALRATGADCLGVQVRVSGDRGLAYAVDLPVAVAAWLAASESSFAEAVEARIEGMVFIGELGLDGSVRSVRGMYPRIFDTARNPDVRAVVVPEGSSAEAMAAAREHAQVFMVSSLDELLGALTEGIEKLAVPQPYLVEAATYPDMREIRLMEHGKFAATVAVAGDHPMLLEGPPGCGKTMLARRIPGIMPHPKALEVGTMTRIASVSGLMREPGLCTHRPFRAPHHTISRQALLGSDRLVLPGEATIASYGVLFLDEVREFSRGVLTDLATALAAGSVDMPVSNASFPVRPLLVAASPSCPCGGAAECKCPPESVKAYRERLPGRLRGLFDIRVDLPRPSYSELASADGERESSSDIRARVMQAHARQDRMLGKGIRYGHLSVEQAAGMFSSPLRFRERVNTDGDYARLLRVALTVQALADDFMPTEEAIERAYALTCAGEDTRVG